MAPKDTHIVNPGTYECSFMCQKVFADVIKDLEMEEISLDYPRGPNVISRVLVRGRQKDRSQRQKIQKWKQRSGRSRDDLLLALKEERATSQGMTAASRSWKRQGDGFSFGAFSRNTGLLTSFFFF